MALASAASAFMVASLLAAAIAFDSAASADLRRLLAFASAASAFVVASAAAAAIALASAASAL
jgi:hypothetical protein